MLKQLIDDVTLLVQQAGESILPFWYHSFNVQKKSDNSPVTDADLAAHDVLVAGLKKLTPNIPILSEEASDIALSTRQTWKRWWLIDPLDGTKEFIDGRQDFTVNVALIEEGHVVFGIVGIPVNQHCFIGGNTIGAWLIDKPNHQPQRIHIKPANTQHLRVVASHRHTTSLQQQLMDNLNQLTTVEIQNIGSSLKFCLLAEGKADCYPRFAPTCQWDTAAAQGVLEGAGGKVFTINGEPLTYMMQESYVNPYFIAIADSNHWQAPLLKIMSKISKAC